MPCGCRERSASVPGDRSRSLAVPADSSALWFCRGDDGGVWDTALPECCQKGKGCASTASGRFCLMYIRNCRREVWKRCLETVPLPCWNGVVRGLSCGSAAGKDVRKNTPQFTTIAEVRATFTNFRLHSEGSK